MKTANNRSAPPLQGEESRRGIALVITLAFIVIITILVVGLSSLLRVERPAANTNFEKRRAALLAAKGTDEVVGALDQFAGDPNRYWISQPGQLIVSNTNGSHALLAIVPLNSGSVQISSSSSPFTGASAVYRPPDLNIIDLSGTSHLISNDVTSGSPVTMPVAWIYIHQDGVESTSDPVTGQPATNDPSSPLVGRYAYWADDESSKINYNMAWGRAGDPTFPVPNQAWAGDQTNINLCALQDSTFSVTPSIANAIHTFIVPDAVSGDPLWKQVGTFFNTPREAQGTGGAPSAALDHFKSDVTNYNHDPDTTFFNQPRIVLTTRPDRAGWTWNGTAWVGKNGQSGPPDANGNITPTTGTPPYLEILNYEGNQNGQQAVPTLSGSCDPGIIADLSLTKMNATVNLLMNYLKRTDWPMMGATGTNSFQAKYYTVGGAGALYSSSNQVVRLAQMAINIIDYVRCAESPDPLVVPLRAWNVTASGTTIDLTSITGPPSGNEQDSYLGAARGPYFTQVAVWCPPSGKYPYVRIEIYNPAEYNIPAISPSQLGLSVEPATDGGGRFVGNTSGIGRTLSTADSGPGVPIGPGQYESFTLYLSGSNSTDFPAHTNQYWRVYLSMAGQNANFDMAPQNEYLSSGTLETLDLEIPVDNFSASTSSNDITSIECDDPRCNSYCMSGNIGNNGVATPPGLDWYIHPPGTNNFPPKDGVATTKTRSTPYCSVGGAPNSLDFPPQDTDVTGKVTDASFYMPPPAGTPANANSPGNPYGAVTSVGELGYVCTGIQTNYLASNGLVNPPPVPWRSFSLQPNSAGPNVVPDWALMDLFTTPTLISGSANIVYQPHTSDAAVGGRINVNSQMTPFSTTRFRPLAALLQGADTSISGTLAINPLTSGSAASIASNIYNKTLAKKGTLYNYPGAYISQGEICEIAGVSDQGEQSEELVRQIASLTTARTGVFSIYAVGQALKQAPSGLLSVTAEQRTQTTVEQISVTTGSIPTVDFRPVYFRALTP